MKTGEKTYTYSIKVSAIFMIMALIWLTISAPYVYASLQNSSVQQMAANGENLPVNDEESNPFGNSNEEKAPGNFSFSEEYLHNHHQVNHFLLSNLQFHKCIDADTYIAFHGELLVPPPNAA